MPRRQGFTLIELLIVVVIIGILASVAVPKFADTKQKAYVVTMKQDLKNLVVTAEAYFADNNTYAGFTAPMGSAGVQLQVTQATATGWQAQATHLQAPNALCLIGIGANTPAGLQEGAPGGSACR
ncbi:MAG: prepilin-type N-terminal cleavage/methylation domain-containing protein [Gemmatimonadetes bacterium]|nr:prepilin-type N-terminal cleavage/methylation domain-containing protein [Gemmatimonadota bacterium]